jgi:predicted nuclease of predicted toxin-antitoxin system
MRFLLDMNLSTEVAAWLRSHRAHEVPTLVRPVSSLWPRGRPPTPRAVPILRRIGTTRARRRAPARAPASGARRRGRVGQSRGREARCSDFDLDFADIVAAAGDARVGVILLRLRSARTVRIIDRLDAVLPSVAQALEKGAVVIVEDARHRIRRLPIGR